MARTGKLAPDVKSDWLDDLIARTTHVGLSSADPFSVADPLTVEPVNGVYHRSAVEWTKDGSLLRNTTALVWPGLPVGAIVTWYVGWTAYANGTPTFACPTPLLSFPNGGGFEVPPLAFYVGFAA